MTYTQIFYAFVLLGAIIVCIVTLISEKKGEEKDDF